MHTITTAIYKNNSLLLEEDINIDEGKKINILIFDDPKPNIDQFMKSVKNNRFNSGIDFKFNREEINER